MKISSSWVPVLLASMMGLSACGKRPADDAAVSPTAPIATPGSPASAAVDPSLPPASGSRP